MTSIFLLSNILPPLLLVNLNLIRQQITRSPTNKGKRDSHTHTQTHTHTHTHTHTKKQTSKSLSPAIVSLIFAVGQSKNAQIEICQKRVFHAVGAYMSRSIMETLCRAEAVTAAVIKLTTDSKNAARCTRHCSLDLLLV